MAKAATKRVDPAQIPRLSRIGGLELRARAVIQGLRSGRHRSPARGASLEFAEHRPYAPGDELRSIDWKAYARSDHLLVRRYVDERALPLGLLVDASASLRWGTPEKRAHALLAAAALGILALDQGDEVRLWAVGSELRPMTKALGGVGAVAQLCDRLAEVPKAKTAQWPQALTSCAQTLHRRGLLVLISDFLDDPGAMAEGLATLRARGHDLVLLQVLAPAELALPSAWQRTRLTDPEGQLADLDCDAPAVAEAYGEALHAHLAALRRTCAAARADHLLAATDQPLAAVLGPWLGARRRHARGA